MEEVRNTASQDMQNKLSPKEIFFKYLVYLPLFIVCIAFAITVGYLYVRYTVPLYKSSISILIKNERGRGGAPPELSLDRMISSGSTNLNNEIMILKSSTTMRRVVTNLGLELQYMNEGKVKRSEMYGYSPIKAEVVKLTDTTANVNISFKKEKGAVIGSWNGNEFVVQNGAVINTVKGDLKLTLDISSMLEGYRYYVYWRSDWSVASELAGSLEVRQQSKDAGVLQISIISEVPQKGADVLNQLIKVYDQMSIEDKNRLANNSIQFIDDRLAILTSELGKVEDGLQGFQQRNNVVDLQIQGSTEYQKMKQLQETLNAQELQLNVIGIIRDYVSTPERKFDLVPSTLGITDATLSSLINNYNELQLSRVQDLRSVPAIHPIVRDKESQIEKIRLSIIESLKNVKSSAEEQRRHKESEYYAALKSLNSIPSKKRELLEIERQQGIKEKLFLYLLQKREELAISSASTSGSTTAIDPAYSWGPVSPNTTNIYRLAFILGIAVPLAFIYIRDLLNDKVITRTDVLKTTTAPVIGEVAHHASMTRKFVVGIKDRSILAEQFRVLRTNLQFLLAHAPAKNPVILVTSSIAGEGKTFCSMNMAAVWAVAGKKTVILELDLRKPKISKALDLQRDIGISNYVIGTVKKEELPQQLSEVPNLYVIGAGPIPPNPSELIMDNKMDELFTYLRANFDMVIIDSAPIGLVSDSKILARFADATLYVVRQRYTVKKQMGLVDELYKNKILPNMGLIVNDVKIGGANSYYGYGYGYGYGYSYNYNYSYSYGEMEKKSLVQRMKDMVGL